MEAQYLGPDLLDVLADELKSAGQARSAGGASVEQLDAFAAAILARPVGVEVSINDLRADLDAAGVPDSARGGLFSRAVKAGLLSPLMVPDGRGGELPVRIPSTGVSAHKATVRVYRRTRPPETDETRPGDLGVGRGH